MFICNLNPSSEYWSIFLFFTLSFYFFHQFPMFYKTVYWINRVNYFVIADNHDSAMVLQTRVLWSYENSFFNVVWGINVHDRVNLRVT